ncbi:MAG: S9 family peptidase [Pseudomonadota bacterium]
MRPFARKLLGLASLAALATAPALAAPMEIEDLPKSRHAGSAVVSPDGEIIAYTVSVPRDIVAGDEDGSADTHLWVIRGDADPVRFMGGHGGLSGLQFAPDGSALHFRARRDGDDATSLYAISLAGGEAQKVFEFETSLGDYAVSPDGGTLYFVAREEDDSEDHSGKGFKAYAFEEDDRLASIWSVSLGEDDAEAEKLFDDGHVSSIELSADGSFLVAAVAPTNLIDDHYMQRDLHVIDAESGEQTARFNLPGKLGGFQISPDGEQIALFAGTDIGDTSDGVLMVGQVDSGDFEQLTPTALQHIQDVDWLNGNILATVHRGVESALVIYNTDGDEEATLPAPDDIVVRSLSAAGDRIVAVADSPSHPRAIFEIDDNGAEKLTNHNAWLDDIDLADQTTFTYEARDGRDIEGLLITPAGDAPRGGWPLILTVHGGPEAHYSDGWLTGYSTAGQFGAGDGYAVFYPNYRGSTGRGVAFSKEHQDDYAGKEFNDLVDGVEALADAGIINRDRVGITGGSYGGYASMWGATALTEHFAASVAFVGISNQVSKFGTSDIPNEMHLVHSLKWPWDGGEDGHWLELLRRSPVFHAGQSTTPTLIMHGEEDTRVHPGQSMELFRSMKVRTETPVRLVFYPGEGHGNRKAAAQFDYSHRLMRWMDTYLAEDASRSDPMPEFDLDLDTLLGSNEDSGDED